MPFDPVTEAKRRLRSQLLAAWSSLTDAELLQLSVAATDHLLASPQWQQAGTIFTFVNMPKSELPTQRLIKAAFSQGKRVAAPVIAGKGLMEAYEFNDLAELQVDAYGILAPNPRIHRQLSPQDIDLVIVPGLAFDRRGYRIGRGGGYYDRYLPRLSQKASTVGWTAERFVLQKVPVHPHDVPVKYIVTEQGMYRLR